MVPFDDSLHEEHAFGEPLSSVVGHLMLGGDHKMRKRLSGILLSMSVYVVCCALAFFGVAHGLARAGFAERLLVVTLVVEGTFYALVRSGWSTRLRDPSLMIWQTVFALGAVTYAYAMVTPDDRGSVLVVINVIVMFGMVTLTPRQAIALGVIAACFLGGTIAVMHQIDPAYYPWQRELIRFELLAASLPALTVTAHYVTDWRTRVLQQRVELRAALERVQQLATRDTLTGLVNRRHMQDLLEQEWQRQERLGVAFAVAIIDLDHFKRINDLHGHRVGDEVLQHFAQAAQGVLRGSDVVARWGGEEFLFLFPDSNVMQAHACLQRLTETLATLRVSEGVPELRVHFSAGVAQHHHGRTLDQTLERADRALYMAKAAGRNRSQTARDTTMPANLGR
ncbi:GGDEF domain-containing protein [Aquabacterium sp.]|uniref:GGDEF domain-containing protein n=1 Tax=Aquabacterium sp. TaxID=1872578 RepID=UPI0035B03D92